MDSELNKKIEKTIDENLLIIKSLVDHFIILFNQKYDIDERNLVIMACYELVQKKFLGSPNSKFEAERKALIGQLVKSYFIKKIENLNKDLEI